MRKRIRIISLVREDRIVKARNESTKTNFMTVVNILMDAMETASRETCLRKPHPRCPARWFNKELKKHLRTMRKD